jgi:hypothetical protein
MFSIRGRVRRCVCHCACCLILFLARHRKSAPAQILIGQTELGLQQRYGDAPHFEKLKYIYSTVNQ